MSEGARDAFAYDARDLPEPIEGRHFRQRASVERSGRRSPRDRRVISSRIVDRGESSDAVVTVAPRVLAIGLGRDVPIASTVR